MNNHKIPKKWGALDFILLLSALTVIVIITTVIFARPDPVSYDELIITYTVRVSKLPERDEEDAPSYWNIKVGSTVYLYSQDNGETAMGKILRHPAPVKNANGTVDIEFTIEAEGYFDGIYYYISTEHGGVRIVGNETIPLRGDNFIFAQMTVLTITQAIKP